MKSKLESFAIIGGGKKENRVENDVYPTPPEVTHALMQFLHSQCDWYFNDIPLNIWEPACDIGGMSNIIESYGHNVTSTDLRHTGYGVGGIDFLSCSVEKRQYDAIITNPPFNISQAFIEKALKDAGIVCMMLKSQYWHAAKRASLFNKNKPAYVLPLTWRPDFSGGGNPTMDCMWTVWIKGDDFARYMPLIKPTTLF